VLAYRAGRCLTRVWEKASRLQTTVCGAYHASQLATLFEEPAGCMCTDHSRVGKSHASHVNMRAELLLGDPLECLGLHACSLVVCIPCRSR
jgi:hypothetical protein